MQMQMYTSPAAMVLPTAEEAAGGGRASEVSGAEL